MIIKAPSNDPLTAIAIARTLADVAPNHPITKHLAVAYWKGGDLGRRRSPVSARSTSRRSWPGVGWRRSSTSPGTSSPGLELIALDPKRSATIIGAEAFADEDTMREVARRAAVDIGVANQEGCANARVIYVLSGTDAVGSGQRQSAGRNDLPGAGVAAGRSSAPLRCTPTANCSTTSRRPG